MQEPKNKQKGITLIALVVTIIVLIILAGVSITMLVGDNGIVTQAQRAKQETEQAEKQEKEYMGKLEDEMNEYITGIEVEQVTDVQPGALEVDKQNANIYIINSIEDLIFFAYDVTNGNNYNGKTVKLGLSLDFNSTKSYVDAFRIDYGKYGYDGELKASLITGEGFQSIGSTTEDDNTKNFIGVFDGDNNYINNLYINVISESNTQEKRGLFANNFGTIKNLKLTNVNLYLNAKDGHIAGIAGQNSSTGNINNCIVSGNIKLEGIQGVVGGITCYCSGKINNCGNLADIYAHTSNVDSTYMGGIFTSCGANAEILNCYNKGDITGRDDIKGLFIGGIGGTSVGLVKNCYNRGKIFGEGINLLRIGGIVGNILQGGTVTSCYTTGVVDGNQVVDRTIGAIIGRNRGGVIQNIYYKETNEIKGIGEADTDENLGVDVDMKKNEEEMKQENFINLLNSENEEVVWKLDANKNDAYPILSWE